MSEPYRPRIASESRFVPARGLRHHVRIWGDPAGRPSDQPPPVPPVPLVMLHGWMDVGASFQFVVDAMRTLRHVIAPDLRGFGLSDRPGADSYWFPDYLGDLDALLDQLVPQGPIDLLGHSMGGNVAMLYGGVRPERVRRLISLESFGLPPTSAADAPKRLRDWLDEVKQAADLRDYDSLQAVAERLIRTNPRLSAPRAAWLAQHWSARNDQGRYEILGDPAHKRSNPYLYRTDETMAVWSAITAPVLLVGAEGDTRWNRWQAGGEFADRLKAVAQLRVVGVPEAGHMVHHDQPARIAELIEEFIDG
jgi:pimeloyl-ACP methyl ester carboxylesterase